MRRAPQREVALPFNKKETPPVESINWWWHPSRSGVRLGPSWFRDKLEDMHPDLECTWDGYNQQYLIWLRKPSVNHPICWGWKLLFPHKGRLEDLNLKLMWESSQRKWGNSKDFMNHLVDEIEREERQRVRSSEADRMAQAREIYRDRVQIRSYLGKGINGRMS